MISYTKRYINIVTFLITVIIYLCLLNSSNIVSKFEFVSHSIFDIFKKNTILVEMKSDNIKRETEEKNENNPLLFVANEEKENKQWKIIIPSISLDAEICDGTSNEVMNKYVGHFKDTSTKYGNIGLAAHNRGYAVNYFANIKKLKTGDKIIYKYYNFEKQYVVSKNIIIKDEDWNYLKETKENTITLITCVENEPQYRRCVQAIEE